MFIFCIYFVHLSQTLSSESPFSLSLSLSLFLSLSAQANVPPVCLRGDAGQQLGDPAGGFWGSALLPGLQGRVQTPT